jgi:hypothetical protein
VTIATLGPLPEFAPRWHAPTGGRHGFTSMLAGLRTIRQVAGNRPHVLWFDLDEPLGYCFRSFGPADLSLIKTGTNSHAPEFSEQAAAGIGVNNVVVVVLSSRGDGLAERSRQQLEESGVRCRAAHRADLSFGSVPYTMTYFEAARTRFEAEGGPCQLPAADVNRADPTASGGAYRFADRGAGSLALLFGPYVTLAPGRYRLDYSLCTDDCSAADPIATYDMVTAGGARTLGAGAVRGTDFAAPHTFRTFSLVVETREPCPLSEFRVLLLGKAGVGVDYVDVHRLR